MNDANTTAPDNPEFQVSLTIDGVTYTPSHNGDGYIGKIGAGKTMLFNISSNCTHPELHIRAFTMARNDQMELAFTESAHQVTMKNGEKGYISWPNNTVVYVIQLANKLWIIQASVVAIKYQSFLRQQITFESTLDANGTLRTTKDASRAYGMLNHLDLPLSEPPQLEIPGATIPPELAENLKDTPAEVIWFLESGRFGRARVKHLGQTYESGIHLLQFNHQALHHEDGRVKYPNLIPGTKIYPTRYVSHKNHLGNEELRAEGIELEKKNNLSHSPFQALMKLTQSPKK